MYDRCLNSVFELIQNKKVHDKYVIDMIIDCEIPVNYHNNGYSIIEIATKYNRPTVVKWLLDNRAFIRSSVKYAVIYGHNDCIKIFEERGYEITMNRDYKEEISVILILFVYMVLIYFT